MPNETLFFEEGRDYRPAILLSYLVIILVKVLSKHILRVIVVARLDVVCIYNRRCSTSCSMTKKVHILIFLFQIVKNRFEKIICKTTVQRAPRKTL